jgi:hypothetical protein
MSPAFIATFTIGIGRGSMIFNLLPKGRSRRTLPMAAVMMTVFLIDRISRRAGSMPGLQARLMVPGFFRLVKLAVALGLFP